MFGAESGFWGWEMFIVCGLWLEDLGLYSLESGG